MFKIVFPEIKSKDGNDNCVFTIQLDISSVI